MKRIISAFVIFVMLCITVGIKRGNSKETIVIYTSAEDYNMTFLQEKLDEEFPEYDIVLEYMSTSNIASKVIEEGSRCEADIVYEMEYGYLEQMVEAGVLADFGDRYDYSVFSEEAINDKLKGYVTPNLKTGGAVILNNAVLESKGIKKPTCYEDLLKPEFKGLISMPNPKSSGTGYMFYKALVNAWGQEKTINYFNGFYKNIHNNFTSSGSGPVNALVQGEAAVGFGMISQAVEKISGGRTDLEVVVFEEGSPFSMYGACVVKGRELDGSVMEVMDYITNVYTDLVCEKYYPESILKGKSYDVKNFPKNIKYSDMKNNNIQEKQKLLKEWRF